MTDSNRALDSGCCSPPSRGPQPTKGHNGTTLGCTLVVLLALLAGCLLQDNGPSLIGQTAPSFVHPTPAGEPITLAQFQGRVRILEFWSPHCGPCRITLLRLAALQRRLGGRGLQVLGLALQGAAAEVQTFGLALQLPFPLALASAPTAQAYGAEVLPTTVLIDRSGRVQQIVRGLDLPALEALEQRAEALLGGP